MKSIKTNEKGEIRIPRTALKRAKLEDDPTLRMGADDGVVIVMKKKMTAMDIITTADSLFNLANSLVDMLADACGVCEDCGDCDGPCFEQFMPIYIPPHILDEAGIPAGAKLCAEVDAENGTLSVMECGSKNLLSEIPMGMLPVLLAHGICVDNLEVALAEGEVVCGGE